MQAKTGLDGALEHGVNFYFNTEFLLLPAPGIPWIQLSILLPRLPLRLR